MSNATVSSQVYIIRNNSALSAVASATMILYADGTDIFAKDANGNTYNLTHPSASSISMGLNNLTDVTIASLSGGDVLQYNSTSGQWENGAISLALGDLSNVSSSNPGVNQILVYDGTGWTFTNQSSGGSVSALHEVGDVWDYSGTPPTTGYVLYWSGSEWDQKAVMSSFSVTDGSTVGTVDHGDSITYSGSNGIALTVSQSGTSIGVETALSAGLNNLSDTANSFTGLATGQVLKYTGSAWSNASVSIGELSDVDITTAAPTSGQTLVWNATNGEFEPGTISGGSGTSAGNQYQIQIADASNGFAAANWEIDANSDLLPITDNSLDLGSPSKKVAEIFVGPSSVNIAKSASASVVGDYATIGTDGTHGELEFYSLPQAANPIHHYWFKDADGSVELHLEGNSNFHFTFKTDSNMAQTQIAKLPTNMPTEDGQALVTSAANYSGANFDLEWQNVNYPPFPFNLPFNSGAPQGSANGMGVVLQIGDATTRGAAASPSPIVISNFTILQNSENWASGVSGDDSGFLYGYTTVYSAPPGPLCIPKTATAKFAGPFKLCFLASGLSSTWATGGTPTTIKVKIKVIEDKLDATTAEVVAGTTYEHEFTGLNLVYSQNQGNSADQWTITIPEADLNSNIFPSGGTIHADCQGLALSVRVYEPSANIGTGATGALAVHTMSMPMTLQTNS